MSFAVAWFAFVCVHAGTVFCYYGAPYLFVNAMLVQLTYLQASARAGRMCCGYCPSSTVPEVSVEVVVGFARNSATHGTDVMDKPLMACVLCMDWSGRGVVKMHVI